MNFFYFDADQRRGPVNAAQLRALAANGTITPETTIEAGGRTLPARKIKGLEFAPAVYPVEEPAPVPEPEPEPEPVTVPAPDPPKPSAAQRAARNSLESWVGFLTFIGWAEIILGAIGGSFCLIAGLSDDKPELIGAGIGSAIGGFVSAILPLSIASIGRFMLTHHD